MNSTCIASIPTISNLSPTVILAAPLLKTAAQSLSESEIIEQPIYQSNSVAHTDGEFKGVAHSFGNDDLVRLRNDDGAGFIIHHGEPVELSGHRIIYSHSETLPLYAPEGVRIDRLSSTQTKNILEGRVKNWSEIGGADFGINLYGPSSNLKKRALAFQMKQADIDLQAPVESSDTYADLKEQLANDRGALVLGLRSEVAQSRNLGSAKRFEPKVESDRLLFDVPIYLYIREGSPEAQETAKAWLNHIASRATEDNNIYPLNDRLKELSRNR